MKWDGTVGEKWGKRKVMVELEGGRTDGIESERT